MENQNGGRKKMKPKRKKEMKKKFKSKNEWKNSIYSCIKLARERTEARVLLEEKEVIYSQRKKSKSKRKKEKEKRNIKIGN